MRESRPLVALAAAAGAMSLVGSLEERVQVRAPRQLQTNNEPRRWRPGYAPFVPGPLRNGDRETARRRRQIAAGQLTRDNGLVV